MSIKNFLLNAGLLLALFIGLSFVAKAMAPPIEYDPVANVYRIRTIDDLTILAMFVDDEGGIASQYPPYWINSGKMFVLMNDIVGLNKSIGTSNNPFMGTFDGNGHKIVLSMSTGVVSSLEAGVFGYTNGATIKNLTTAGYISYFDYATYGLVNYRGAIVNYGINTTITNCTNLADITIDCSNPMDIGGIAGYMYNSTITSCSNSGNITTGDAGSDIGGIVGCMQSGSVSECVNIGKVKGWYYIGGIVGLFNSESDGINNCMNAGWVDARSHVGGIIGCVYYLGFMQNCLNTGVVQGTTSVYSLIGENFVNASLSNKISNCYYDNQMSIYAGIQGIANPSTVYELSTSQLTKPAIKDALGDAWTIYPNAGSGLGLPITLLPNQYYSYPTLKNTGSAIVAVAAAMPARLATNDRWNYVTQYVNLDVGYYVKYSPVGSRIIKWPPHTTIEWQSNELDIPYGYLTSPYGHYFKRAYNPTPGHSGISELVVYYGDIRKTVPIFPIRIFKISVDEYETYGFETSEISPNIVTSNAVIDISLAIEGNLNVAVFDMSGAKVMNVVDKNITAQSQTQVELNGLHNLTAGSYMVAVSLGNNVVFRRFIKQ